MATLSEEDLLRLQAGAPTGWMWKRGVGFKSWKRRWFQLRRHPKDPTVVGLGYHEKEGSGFKGMVPLDAHTRILTPTDVHLLSNAGDGPKWPGSDPAARFAIITPGRTFWLEVAHGRSPLPANPIRVEGDLDALSATLAKQVLQDMADPLECSEVNGWVSVARKTRDASCGLKASTCRYESEEGGNPDLWRTSRSFYAEQKLLSTAVQPPQMPAQYGTHATEPKSSPELGRYLERVKSGRGVYLFVDLRYLYDQPDWAKLCGPAWNGLAATPPSLPPWAKLVLEEELAGFKYIFCSHMWFTSWPVWERSPMRDFWCVSAAQRYFGEGDPKSVGSWVASEEPIWLWCDKVTNPQADPTNSVFADLFRWTTTKFAALATEAHTFALYHGYKLLSWTECADKVLIIVDALASRVFADNADSWKKHANRFTLFARVMNSLPGPGLILPSGAYAERAWCQVEVAARRASTGSGILGEGFCIPLLQHGAQCQHPTVPDDVGTYLSLYDWAHVVSEQFSAVLGVDVEQIWQARHMDGSVATRAMRDLMRREMPNHEATGTTTSILLCSSISVFDDIHAILPRHVLNIYLRTGRVIPERCDSESILHTVQAFTKAAVGSSGEQWDEAAVKGALHLACASAIDLSSMRWGVYKRLRVPVEFVGALMGILVHFNDNVKDGLRTALQPYDSCESIGEYMESVCQAYGIASPAQVFTKASESSATGKAGLRRPCTDLQTWSKLDRSEVLFTDETGTPIFAKAGPDLYSVPLCPPEMFIGTAVVTEQLWAGGHTMDWGNLQLRVVPAKLPASASMAERLDSRGLVSFAGLLDNIRTDADYMKDGYIPAGCTGGNFERW